MPSRDPTVCGEVKHANIASLKTYIERLMNESKLKSPEMQAVDRIEIAAWSRLLDEYVRGEFAWESIFPKPVTRG